MKKTCLIVFLICLTLTFSLPARADTIHTPDVDISAEFVFLYNLDTQKVIYEKNPDKQCYPASVTKIMTCILALENTPDIDREIVTYPTYVQDYLYTYQKSHGVSVSLAGLLAGETMTMRELLYGLMLRSGNETAMIIADHIGGSQEKFVEMMNERARQLGATNTNFVNPNGLFDPQHVTTARDMALISKYAYTLPGFMDICSTVSYVAGPTNKHDKLEWSTTIQMMQPNNSHYYPYLKGMKTGTLPESGRCLVSTATRDGFTYLLVIMGAPYRDSTGAELEARRDYIDTRNIYEWAFDNFKVKSLVEKNRMVAELPLRLSTQQDFLQLVTAERFTALVPKDVDPTSVTMIFDLPESVDAPVEKGEKMGTVTLLLFGEEMGSVDLLSAEKVDASRLLILLEQIKAFLRSFWFKFAVVFVVLLIILYSILMIARNRNRRRYSSYKPRRRL